MEGRYAFLLQPVRDLQHNWDIDIGEILEQFLHKIRELSDEQLLSEKNDKEEEEEKFNFAEAAILIQGSTMVYGKKVEYVHALARDFYEQLKDKKNARKGNDNVDDTEDEAAQRLDDPCELIHFTKLRAGNWKRLMLKGETKPPPLLPQIPISLMPLGEFEKTNVPLYSSRNVKEVIGKKDDFIINTGFIHNSGALLLDLANGKLLDDFAVQDPISDNSACADESVLLCNGQLGADDNEPIHTDASEFERVRRATSATNLNTVTRRDTSHTELVSGIANGDDEMRSGAGKDCIPAVHNGSNGDMEFAGQGFENDEDDHHPADEEVFGGADEDEPVMDLFRPQQCKHAPYQACKPSFVPTQVEKRRLKKREKLGLKALSTLNNFLQQHVYRCLPKGTVLTADDDFTHIFGRLIRNLEKQRMNVIKERVSRHPEHYQLSEYDAQSGDDEEEPGDYGNTNNGYSSDEAEGSHNTPGNGNLTFANMPNDDLEDRVHVSSLYMNFDDPGLILKPSEQMTYQDLLKVHLQKYWSSAEETTSKLCKRVQLWEEKIQPLLEEEETRREFNVHQYGNELLKQYESIGEAKDFAELVENVSTQYDISRYCLALLMLANTGNIEVNCSNRIESTNDGKAILLKLLKRERHHQQFSESHVLTT